MPTLPAEQKHALANIGQLLPDLFAVFDAQQLHILYLNPAGLNWWDPKGAGSTEQLTMTDLIGMNDIDRFQREIFLQLRVHGRWTGALCLRDALSSEFQFQVRLMEVVEATSRQHHIYMYASLSLRGEATQEVAVSGEDMLYALLATTPDRIVFKDANGRYLRLSQAKAERHFLKNPGDAIGKTDFDFFIAEHAAKAMREEQHVMKTAEAIIDREEKLTYDDGRISWASTTRLPFRNREGRLIGTYSVAHDITTRKMVEEKLRMLSRVVEQSPVSIMITDKQGRIEYVNAWFEKITGFSAAEVMGQNPRILKSGNHPEELYREMWSTLSAGEEWIGEIQNRRKNSELFWEQVVIFAIRNDQGEITHYIAIKEDITERKKVEERRMESEALFKAVFAGSSDAILLLSENRVLDCNARTMEMFGYPREAILNLHPADLSPPEQPDGRDSSSAAGEHINRAIETGLSRFEWVYRRSGGVDFPAEVVLSAFVFHGRSMIHGIVRDVSGLKQAEKDRREMEARLQLSSKLESVGSLAAGVAHEINTPTQFISDNTRFLMGAFSQISRVLESHRDLIAQSAAHAEYGPAHAAVVAAEAENELEYLIGEIPRCLDQSLEGLRRISKIVGSLKEFSHPGGEEKSHADLNRAIETTVSVSRHEWKYVADVVTELDPALPPVHCVLDEINQAVLNLVVNAAHAIDDAIKKHGRKRGCITIRTKKEADQAIIEVQDTGTGVPENIRARIFEPFFTTKGIGKGTGQGLAIVQAVIVKKHHGTIGFTTELGKGTTFKISLPIAPVVTPQTVVSDPPPA